jgi:hypothetical protein
MIMVPAQEWRQMCDLIRWIAGRVGLAAAQGGFATSVSPDEEIGMLLPAMPPGLRSHQSVIKAINSGRLPGYKAGNRWKGNRAAMIEAAHKPSVVVVQQQQKKQEEATHAEAVESVAAFLTANSRRGKTAVKTRQTEEKPVGPVTKISPKLKPISTAVA